MEFWQHIYEQFSPVAFALPIPFTSFSLPVHWYGMMYILALLSALFIAKWIVKKDNLDFCDEGLDSYFIWVEVGVIIGARVGYVLFYDTNTEYYLSNPWQMFNPFLGGQFVGISGMSFHGAILGFLAGSLLFTLKNKQIKFWAIMDLAAVSIPLAFTFGRIGNFLNQELIGRATDVPWGIYVHNTLRHPSQLYEAFLEGIVVFIIIYWYRMRKKFEGELILMYLFLYSIMRSLAEMFRAPDKQLGFIYSNWLTMGQLLSGVVVVGATGLYFYLREKNAAEQAKKKKKHN